MKKLRYLWEINIPTLFIRFCRNFGFLFTFKYLLFQGLAFVSKYHLPYQHHLILKFLTKNFRNEIEKLKHLEEKQVFQQKSKEKIPVWVLWWQGEADMPKPVEMCIKSHKKYLDPNKYEYHLLTKENFSQFVKIPEFIAEKVQKNEISLTHFSEIIRVGLLKEHGGLWMDVNLLMVDKLGEEIHDLDFYSNKKFSSPWRMRRYISQGRWISGFMSTNKGNLLCEFLWQAFISYWKQHDIVVNYYMIDYLIEVAYQHFSSIREQIDTVPENNIRYYDLADIANNKLNIDDLDRLFADHSFFLFSRKCDYKEATSTGEKTIYRYLLDSYGVR